MEDFIEIIFYIVILVLSGIGSLVKNKKKNQTQNPQPSTESHEVFDEQPASYDGEDEENLADFCYPIEGYEAPYGKAQLVMITDTAVTDEFPANTEELMEFCKKYEGKVTYPALPDFTGSAFVRNIIYEICGYEQFMDMEADKETVKAAIEPGIIKNTIKK